MYRTSLVSLLISFLAFAPNVRCYSSTIGQTLNGPIQGIELTSSLGQKYVAFKGVRYAMSPITGIDPITGDTVDRRFKPPEPINQNWTENRMAQSYGKVCVPSSLINTNGSDVSRYSEDCLFLNIYVPANGSMWKTVLVFIHGGSFDTGDSTDAIYGPDFLISQDNILVTMQYRLGIFGFLNLNCSEYTGNMALKDQQLALKWVHENIEYFSGKKNEILLFGQSSGATCVQLQVLNVESRKYFNRAYVMSGSALSCYVVIRNATYVEQLQAYTKIQDMNDLIEYLKRANATDLNKSYQPDYFDKLFKTTWVPTIESPNTVGAFMTKTAVEQYGSVNAPIMDVMFSMTMQESIAFVPSLLVYNQPLLQQNWTQSDPAVVLLSEGILKSTPPETFQQAIQIFRNDYFGNTTNVTAIRNANIALLGDMIFNDDIIHSVVLQTIANTCRRYQQKNTFLFRFSVSTNLTFFSYLSQLGYKVASHGDDLYYIFDVHQYDQYKLYDIHLETKDEIYDLIMRSVKMITNFARTGNPSIAGDTPFKSCRSENAIFCQEISNKTISSVTYDIKNQTHYDTWRTMDKITLINDNNNGTCNTFNRPKSNMTSDILGKNVKSNDQIYLPWNLKKSMSSTC